MIAKQLTGTGLMWTHYLQTCTYAYNSFASPTLKAIGPFQLTYGRLPKVFLQTETNPQEGIAGSFKEYYELLRKRFVYFHKTVQEHRLQQLDMINKDKPMNNINQVI